MLYAKIEPTAKINKKDNPFISSTREVNYMTVVARPYAAGSSIVNFEIQFGELQYDYEQNITGFELVSSMNTSLTRDELSTWGTDDSVLLTLIATKIGTNAISFYEVSEN